MKKRQYLLSFIFSLIITNVATHNSFAASEQIKVIAFGDSITAGLFRTTSNFRLCTHDGSTGPTVVCIGNGIVNRGGYVSFLADQLESNGFDATVYNWGISGDRTSGMVNRVNSVLAATPSDYIAIMGGANDARNNFSRSLIIFNYNEMINSALNANVVPLIGTVTPNFENTQFQLRVESYNVEIREIAEQVGCEGSLADQHAALANFNIYTSGDFLHVGSAGNERMATEWFSSIQNAIDCSTNTGFNIAPILNTLLLGD